MRAAEILRSIADMVDRADPQHGGSNTINPNQTAKLTVVAKPEVVAPETPETDTTVDTMVPPLQQKIELLKKAVGVDSIYDTDQQPDELAILKQNAGIRPEVSFAAASDVEDDQIHDATARV
jgi:hypothetical protein